MKKCSYCAKEIGYHEMYCSSECEEKYTSYFTKRTKFQKLLSSLNIVGTCSIAVGIFLYAIINIVGAMLIACGALAVGLITIFLPTPTDNIIEKHKLKKAVTFTRYFGFFLTAVGVAALIFAITLI